MLERGIFTLVDISSLICFEDLAVTLPVEKRVAKGVEFAEGLLWVDNQSVTGYHAILIAVHHRDERVCGRLRANPHTGEVLLHEVPDEGGLPGRVLTHQQDHGFVVEVGIFECRGVEVVESIRVLQREQFGPVKPPQPLGHVLKQLRVLLQVFSEHDYWLLPSVDTAVSLYPWIIIWFGGVDLSHRQ